MTWLFEIRAQYVNFSYRKAILPTKINTMRKALRSEYTWNYPKQEVIEFVSKKIIWNSGQTRKSRFFCPPNATEEWDGHGVVLNLFLESK